MTMARVEVITSVQRRRRWSLAEKERLVAEALESGAVASEVARRAGIHTSQLFRWRQLLCRPIERPTEFTAVTVAPAPEAGPQPSAPLGMIEIELPSGARVRIGRDADPTTVSAAVSALAGAERRR